MSEVSAKLSFAKATNPFIQRGQFPIKDLLPIIPPGAKLGSKSAVDSSQVGKVPGRFEPHSQLWYGLTGAWPTMGLSDNMAVTAQSWPTENVGLRAENWPAVDVDVASEHVRDLVEGLVNFHLGHAPVRVRAGAPRALLVFRKIGDEPIRKMRLVFKDTEGLAHAVEILGAGQQYLIHGTHPTGAQYEWRESAELASWGADCLTKITALDARNFMDALAGEVIARGWTIVTDVRLRPSAGGVGHAVKDLEPLVPSEIALAALQAIPNTEDTLPMREDLVSIIAAFKAATGKESEQYREDVIQWATSQDWADEEYVSGVWRSLTHVRVGPERLFGSAHKFGFVGDAQEDFKDDPVAVETKIAAAKEDSDEQAAKIGALSKRLLYWEEQQQWIVRDTGQIFSHAALNASLGKAIAPSGATGVRAASNILLNADLMQKVMGHTYLPGKPVLATWAFNGKSAMYYNRWIDAEHSLPATTTDEQVKPWLDHIEYLFENAEDREYLLDFIAHTVQHRGKKIRWAPIIIGNQGVGKDLFLRPLLLGFAHNARTVQPQDLMGRFIDFYEKELVIVEEMMRFEKNEIYERMKATISGTASDTNTVERKFQMPYEVPNVVNFIFFSNHTDALNLSHDDRRFFVINSFAKARSNDYYTKLADDFYIARDGWKHVWTWLKQRDISAFNPNHRPRMTDDKLMMIEESQPQSSRWLATELSTGMWKHRSVITVSEILDRCSTDFGVPEPVRKHMRWASQATDALRYVQWHRRSKQVRLDAKPERPWCRTPELAECDGDLLRARYKAEVEKKLANVG
jgi:hypothetical protein